MRVVVNREVCQGHLRCWNLAPELFEVDDLGYATAADIELTSDELIQRAESAVRGCPEAAISFESDG